MIYANWVINRKMPKSLLLKAVVGGLLLVSPITHAEPFKLPIQLDYGLIKQVVVSQLFKGESGSVEVWHDKHNCSSLKLSNPRISGEAGQLKLLNDVDVHYGAHLMGNCLPVLAWNGALETLQQPTISADGATLSIPVTQANAFDQQGRKVTIDKLQDLLTKVAKPKLADVKLDLNKSRTDIERVLLGLVPKEQGENIKKLVSTLKFNKAEANNDGIKLELAFDAPLGKITPKPEAAFSAEEQKQWQGLWQHWDQFLTKAIDQAAKDSKSQKLQHALQATLTESRTAFHAAVRAERPTSGDPVRTFFVNSWERLSPQLRELAQQMPELQSLRYLNFIAATDIIYQLDSLGAPLGLEISSDGLRRIARLLLAEKQAAAPKN
jgi:hypothetical protein